MKKLLYFAFFMNFAFFGTVNADTETLNWVVDGQTYTTTTCESGGDIILPNPPSKPGYVFRGWRLAYTPIEYIESTGTQYIDTKVYQKDAKQYGMSLKYEYSNATSNTVGSVCGFMSNSANNWGQPFNVGYGRKSELWGGRPNRLIFESDINISPNTVYYDNFSVNVENGTATRMFNGYTQDATGIPFGPGEANYTQSVFLFAANGGSGGPAQNVSIRLYYAKFFLDNVLVRDFIPILDKNNIPCMYDKVEGKFYYNAGTGGFTAGPAIIE